MEMIPVYVPRLSRTMCGTIKTSFIDLNYNIWTGSKLKILAMVYQRVLWKCCEISLLLQIVSGGQTLLTHRASNRRDDVNSTAHTSLTVVGLI